MARESFTEAGSAGQIPAEQCRETMLGTINADLLELLMQFESASSRFHNMADRLIGSEPDQTAPEEMKKDSIGSAAIAQMQSTCQRLHRVADGLAFAAERLEQVG